MKTQTSSWAFVMLLLSIAVATMPNNANARSLARRYIAGKHVSYTEDSSITYKPFIGNSTLKLNNISMKAMRDFLFRFKEVNNENWYKVEGGFVARFISGAATNIITYNKNGEWLYTIGSYDEKSMPEEIKLLIKATYQQYDMLSIKEIQVPNNDSTIFLIYIQDAATIKVLRVCAGEMEIIHDYIRG